MRDLAVDILRRLGSLKNQIDWNGVRRILVEIFAAWGR